MTKQYTVGSLSPVSVDSAEAGAPELIIEVSSDQIAEGVRVFDELSDSFAPSGLVERIYIAMRALENHRSASSC